MFGLGPAEMMIVLVIGVLLFGKNLPNVGRSLGKSLMELKRGLSDIKSEMDVATYSQPSSTSSQPSSPSAAQPYTSDDDDEPTAPKFEPPAQEPYEPPPHDPSATGSQSENTQTQA